MSRALRISMVLAAVLAAIAAFTVLRPDDQPAVPEPALQARDTPAGTGDDTAEPTPTPTPEPPLLTAANARKLSFRQGDTIVFRVRHPSREELHVHGYDVTRALPAGKTVTLRFAARIEGIFEIELHGSGTRVGSLQVEP